MKNKIFMILLFLGFNLTHQVFTSESKEIKDKKKQDKKKASLAFSSYKPFLDRISSKDKFYFLKTLELSIKYQDMYSDKSKAEASDLLNAKTNIETYLDLFIESIKNSVFYESYKNGFDKLFEGLKQWYQVESRYFLLKLYKSFFERWDSELKGASLSTPKQLKIKA